MSFDETQPTDTTKIRDLGVVIRPNWVAIQEADSTFIPWALNLLVRTNPPLPTVDPANIATAYQLYSKTDGSADELFGLSPAGNIIQLTKGSPVVGTNGSTFLPGGLILKFGQSTIAGASSSVAVNFTTLSLGQFPNAFIAAWATPLSASAGLVSGNYPGINGGGVNGFNINRNSSGGGLTYYWVAIGR